MDIHVDKIQLGTDEDFCMQMNPTLESFTIEWNLTAGLKIECYDRIPDSKCMSHLSVKTLIIPKSTNAYFQPTILTVKAAGKSPQSLINEPFSAGKSKGALLVIVTFLLC